MAVGAEENQGVFCMVEKRIKNIKNVLKAYREKLEETIKVNQMILFGSYARGTQRDYSDIDVAVISDNFQGNSQDYLILDRAARAVTPLIEAFPYTTQEMKERQRGSFLDEILKTGKKFLK